MLDKIKEKTINFVTDEFVKEIAMDAAKVVVLTILGKVVGQQYEKHFGKAEENIEK